MAPSEIPDRSNYRLIYSLTTRWGDNDIYGHINNVIYYSYFDSVVNRYLIEEAGLDINGDEVVCYVVSSGCDFHAPISYPEQIEAGIRVDKLGNRSVTYGVAIFKCGESLAAAHGHFVHVFVDKREQKAVPIPAKLRSALEKLTY